MTTVEIRSKLVEQRTLYQASLKEADKACAEIKNILDSIDDGMKKTLAKYGFSLGKLENIDFNLLRSDSDYVNSLKVELDSLAASLHTFLEAEVQ